MKLTKERAWFLKHWLRGGWSIPRPDCIGVKKWDGHLRQLLKHGLLEEDPEFPVYRITDAGRAELDRESGK